MRRVLLGIASLAAVLVAVVAFSWLRHRSSRWDEARAELTAVDDERALLLAHDDGTLRLSLVDAGGQTRWTRELDCDDEVGLDRACDERLRLTTDAEASLVLVSPSLALDLATGADRWRVPRPSRGTLALAAVRDAHVVVIDGGDPLLIEVADASSGQTRWEREGEGQALRYFRYLPDRLFVCGDTCVAYGWDDGTPEATPMRPGQLCSTGELFAAFVDGALRWGSATALAEALPPEVSTWLRGSGPTSLTCGRRGDRLVVGARYGKPSVPSLLRLLAIDLEGGTVPWQLELVPRGRFQVEPTHRPLDFSPLGADLPALVPFRVGNDLVLVDVDAGRVTSRTASRRTHVSFELLLVAGRHHLRTPSSLGTIDGATGRQTGAVGLYGQADFSPGAVWFLVTTLEERHAVGQLDPATLVPTTTRGEALLSPLPPGDPGW